MERPAGVAVLAVLSIAFATVVGLIGVLAILWDVILKSPPDSWGLGKYFAIGGALIAAVCFGIATLYVAMGAAKAAESGTDSFDRFCRDRFGLFAGHARKLSREPRSIPGGTVRRRLRDRHLRADLSVSPIREEGVWI